MSRVGERLIGAILKVIAFSALASLLLITVFIFKEGIPFFLKHGPARFLFSAEWRPMNGHFGVFAMIIASLAVTFGAMMVGAPLGISGAVFLNEFAPKPIVKILKPAIELLAGIPSVVYGFIGVVVVAPVIREHWGGPGLSLLCAALILGIMILPTVMSISVDALNSVPNSYREGALALGATRWQSVYMVVLKAARSGIVAAVVLGLGRAIGETMAVIMVAGNTVQIPKSIFDPVRTLTANIAMEMSQAVGEHREALFATGVILFVIIMTLNSLALVTIRKTDGR